MTVEWKADETCIVVSGTWVNGKWREEAWAGRVVKPSVIGEGWWLVRMVNFKTGYKGGLYTIPEREMQRPKA